MAAWRRDRAGCMTCKWPGIRSSDGYARPFCLPDSAHLLRIVEKALLDQLIAAPGLPGDLLHAANRTVLAGEFESPADGRMIAVVHQRPEPRGLDAGDRGQYRAFARGQRLTADPPLAIVLLSAGVGCI